MKKILFIITLFLSLTSYGQLPVQKGEKWIFHDSLNIDDGLKIGYKSGPPASSLYYTRYNQLGRLYLYNDVTPALGMLLKGNGTYYDNFSKGTAGQFLKVNSAGTDLEWKKIKKADVDDLDAYEILFGNTAGNGQIQQDDDFKFDPLGFGSEPTLSLTNTQTGLYITTLGSYLSPVTDGNYLATLTPGGIVFNRDQTTPRAGSYTSDIMQISYSSGGVAQTVMSMESDRITWYTVGGLTTSIFRTAGGSVHNLFIPNTQGGANTTLRNDGSGNLTWVPFGTGSVTSFSFTDNNGFDGTVSTATTTPTLELTTNVADKSVMFSNTGGIFGDADFWFDLGSDELHLDGVGSHFIVGGLTTLGTATPTEFANNGKLITYNGVATAAGDLLIGDAGGGAMRILPIGSPGDILQVNVVGLEPEWVTPTYGPGTVTSFAFTDGSGFDGTIINATSTPTLSLTTTLSTDQVMFAGASGAVTGDARFKYNPITGRALISESLDIGFTTTTDDLHITKLGSVTVVGTAYGPTQKVVYAGQVTEGTIGAETAIHAGRIMLELGGQGHDGTSYSSSSSAMLRIVAAEDFAPTDYGTEIQLWTTPLLSATRFQRMTIAAGGNVGIGVSSPSFKMDIDGDLNLSTGSMYKINGSNITTSNIAEGSNLYYTNERVDDQVDVLVVDGTNITTAYNDVANTFTINSSYSSIVGACVGGLQVTASTTAYTQFMGMATFSATEAQRQFVMPIAGTMSNLYIRTGGTQPASGNAVFTVRKNGVATTLTYTLVAGTVQGAYTGGTSFTFVAGDLISFEVANAATASSANIISISTTITN